MHLAAMYNHYSCIDALLKHQSEAMDIKNDHGNTPLQVFCTRTKNRNGLYNYFLEVSLSNILSFVCFLADSCNSTSSRIH